MSAFQPKQKQPPQGTSSTTAGLRTPARSINQQEHPSLNLQRTIGNQAVLRLLRAGAEGRELGSAASRQGFSGLGIGRIPVSSAPARTLQTKLAVNTPGDAFEQEADRVADQVMRMPNPSMPPSPAMSGGVAGVQRACACGGTCSDCKNAQHDDEHAHVQMKSVGPASAGGMEAPPIVHEVLRSPGQPLDAATRAFMEPRFGHDFSGLRVHTDARAAESAQAIGALAYTAGQNIVFAPGQHNAASYSGRKLIAHELSHTLQAAPAGTAARTIMRKDDAKKPPECKKVIGPIRPVFFKDDAKDKSPTGQSLSTRLAEANRIWDKCGINFSAGTPRVIEEKDAKHANSGTEFSKLMDAHGKSGSGPEVFFFDSDLKFVGGGVKGPKDEIGDEAKIMLSDQGANKRLLAHELGHAMGNALLHPDAAPYIPPGTIMEPSGIDGTNPDVVTQSMCALIEWPKKIPAKECLHPDPDPPKAAPQPPQTKDPKESQPPKK